MVSVGYATRRSWWMWIVAVVLYFFSVFHRTSLGVAGLQAGERFGVGPAALSTFAVSQAAIYAFLQIPTGLLVDRLGPRPVLATAAVLLGTGEAGFALAPSYPVGLAARALVGLGDAMVWVSLLRLVTAYFPARRYALIVSMSAALGALGGLLSTLPLAAMLRSAGWTATFLGAGITTVLVAVVAGVWLRNEPANTPAQARPPARLRDVADRVLVTWRSGSARLGFWVHFSTAVGPTTLGLLWGFPFLVRAEGLSEAQAGSVLAVLVFGAVAGGPVVGALTSRRPGHRMPMVIGFLVGTLGVWAVLLGWPGGRVPTPLLFVAFFLLALGGPISGIGFAVVRDYSPAHRIGTATGLVNVGAFVATAVATPAIGLLLTLLDGVDPLSAYRVALLAVVGLVLIGTWRTAVWWRRIRAAVFAAVDHGREVPVVITRRRWDIPAGLVEPIEAAA